MNQASQDLKMEITKGLSNLQTLRDEIRVRLHLAGMEAKERWNQLEPRFQEVEKAAENVSDASRKAVVELVKQFQSLRSSLV